MAEPSAVMGIFWTIIGPYVNHKSSCTYSPNGTTEDSDFCTCGLAQAKQRLRDIKGTWPKEEK